MNSLTDKLKWYHRHQDKVLDYRHRTFVNYDPTTLHKWHRRRMIEQLDLLETAHSCHDNATSQLADNQTTLSSWIGSPTIPHGGVVHIECTNTLDQLTQTQSIYTDSNSTTSSQEREFNLEIKSNTPRVNGTQHTTVHKQAKPKGFDPNQKKPLLQASHNFNPDD